jgi:hypothetical protein
MGIKLISWVMQKEKENSTWTMLKLKLKLSNIG